MSIIESILNNAYDTINISLHISNGNKWEKTCILFASLLGLTYLPYSCVEPLHLLQLLGLTIVVIHDSERLLIAGLVHVLAHVRPVQPEGLGVGVTAGQELEGHPAEADLGLLEEALAPRRQLVQLGEDEAGLPVGGRDTQGQCVFASDLRDTHKHFTSWPESGVTFHSKANTTQIQDTFAIVSYLLWESQVSHINNNRALK